LDGSVAGDNADGTDLVPENAIGIEVQGEVRTDGEDNISANERPGLQVDIDGSTVESENAKWFGGVSFRCNRLS